MPEASIVVGIGELLWDVFPSGKRLGGAPVNFACHCAQLGAEVYPVSAIGCDAHGLEIREALSTLGVDARYVTDDPSYPTGTVQVELDDDGKPSYEICEDVAWDMIPTSCALTDLARKADAVCFGSLAQRHAASRETIHAFMEAMRPDALKIFDVNLRQDFYSEAILERSLQHANVLKLSDEELPELSRMWGIAGAANDWLAALAERFELDVIAYTRGPNGSLLMAANTVDDHPGYSVEVVDSVGAGDSFTAARCTGLLKKAPHSRINDHANRIATYVCSQMGATPRLPETLREMV